MNREKILERALNAYLRLDPEALKQLIDIQGYCVKIQLIDLSKHYFLVFESNYIKVQQQSVQIPIAVIEGKSYNFISSFISQKSAQTIQIHGNVEIGYQVYGILKNVQIDWEEQLSHYTGDMIAHSVGNFVRKLAKSTQSIRANLRENVTEYLHEEMRCLPSVYELEDFYKEVELMSQEVDRVEAYLNSYFNCPSEKTQITIFLMSPKLEDESIKED